MATSRCSASAYSLSDQFIIVAMIEFMVRPADEARMGFVVEAWPRPRSDTVSPLACSRDLNLAAASMVVSVAWLPSTTRARSQVVSYGTAPERQPVARVGAGKR